VTKKPVKKSKFWKNVREIVAVLSFLLMIGLSAYVGARSAQESRNASAIEGAAKYKYICRSLEGRLFVDWEEKNITCIEPTTTISTSTKPLPNADLI
jgi:hypothetical protein